MTLDLHDWSVVNNRMDLLYKLKDYFPDFKVSLFTVPFDAPSDWGAYQSRKEILREIKELDWLQFIPHGYFHTRNEMRNADYRYFKEVTLPVIKMALEKDGLKYEKGFCAPHWRWSDGVVKALDEEGWWGAVDPRQPMMRKTKRFYQYTHAINTPLDECYTIYSDNMKLHGHVYGTRNDLGLCLPNLLKLPRDTKWEFITNYIQTNE